MNNRSVFSGDLKSLILIFLITGCLISCQTASDSYESRVGGNHFSGRYMEGDGDVKMLDNLNAAFESTRPSPKMANLPLLYKRDWNGYVEGPVWPCWWIQNTYGATYSMMPFLGEEPGAFLCTAQKRRVDRPGLSYGAFCKLCGCPGTSCRGLRPVQPAWRC